MSIRIPAPPSPQSTSSALSSSPPALHPDTLALLNSFIASKTEEERRFNELVEQAAARVAGLALEADARAEAEGAEEPMMSVDEYRLAFGEDWQLSQFWYTTPFAMRLARILHNLCTPTTSVAFVCCPTAFVAFQHIRPRKNARLLEFDGRFSVLAPRQYVPYDMEEPTALPAHLSGSVDIAIVDPPFLNEYTNTNVIKTLRQIMRPTGKLLVITSTSVTPVLEKLYDSAPLGPLRMTQIEVVHGQLRNDFACWGSWDGAEELGAGDDVEVSEAEEEGTKKEGET